jgi:hypothetical protein
MVVALTASQARDYQCKDNDDGEDVFFDCSSSQTPLARRDPVGEYSSPW